MGKKKEDEVLEETTEETTEPEAAEEAAPAKGKKGEVTVVYPGGQRTYSKEVHGEDFLALAKEFAAKREGKVM
jgi:hypothetical protein